MNDYFVKTRYAMDFDSAEWVNTGGNTMIAEIPVSTTSYESYDGREWARMLDEPFDHYYVLAGPDGVGVYHTVFSPLVDDDQFETQVVYYDWYDTAQYVTDSDGNEYLVGYKFDGPWADVCKAATDYYKAREYSTGLM